MPTNSSSGARILHTVVVVDFISNPAALTDDQKTMIKSGKNSVLNAPMIDRMPRNSIIGIITSDGMAKSEARPRVFYPFFPPYLSLPVKPGEKVWAIFEKSGETGGSGFWISRVSSDIDVDDVNYTHHDRYFERPSLTATSKVASQAVSSTDPPGYPNGDPLDTSQRTLPEEDGYTAIVGDEATSVDPIPGIAMGQFTGESVPRYSKNAPDMILQGSNNTLIRLGEDIGGHDGATLDEETGLLAINDPEIKQKGTIDIVAGRDMAFTGGTYLPGMDEIENTRAYNETDKRKIIDGEALAEEGQVNFENDLSRIYVSMQTSADTNFGLEVETDTATSTEPSPAIVVKTDQVRIVARDDLKIIVGDKTTGSAIILRSTGDIIFVPGSGGVIKLGGDDANLALLTSGNAATAGGDGVGTVTAAPLGDTMGGLSGGGGSLGSYATKILVK